MALALLPEVLRCKSQFDLPTSALKTVADVLRQWIAAIVVNHLQVPGEIAYAAERNLAVRPVDVVNRHRPPTRINHRHGERLSVFRGHLGEQTRVLWDGSEVCQFARSAKCGFGRTTSGRGRNHQTCNYQGAEQRSSHGV